MRPSIFLAVLLAGCAGHGAGTLRPGIDTEADVRTVMGAPAGEYPHADGSRNLAYPHGPLGTQTFMADVGADGKLSRVRAVLNDDTFHQVVPGMSREEVLRLIGPPGEVMEFARLGQVSWDYRFVDTWGYLAIFSVNFDRHWAVVGKFTRRIERDRERF